MIVRIRPNQPFTFDEYHALVAVGAAGNFTMAARVTGLSKQDLGAALQEALLKLPDPRLVAPPETLAALWWRGIDRVTWTGKTADGTYVVDDGHTLWDDRWEALRQEHQLARGRPLDEIVARVRSACITLPER